MAEFQTQQRKQREAETVSGLISIFMSVAALVYCFVMGMNLEPKDISWYAMVPPISLLVGAMWILIKPAKDIGL